MSRFDGLLFVRRGALAGGVLCALILLGVFHSVVSGAVHRAELRRSEAVSQAAGFQTAPSATGALRAAYFPSRRISLARAGD